MEQCRTQNCPRVGLLTSRDVPLPHARGMPGAAGQGAAADKRLIQRHSPASAAAFKRRREGEASEALEMFEVHRRGIKLRVTPTPALYNSTAGTGTLESRTQPRDGKEGAELWASGTRNPSKGGCFRRDKKQMFHKSSLSRFIK